MPDAVLGIANIYPEARGGPKNEVIYSFVLIYAGAGLLINSLLIVLLLPVGVLGFTWGIVIRDERYLEGVFGDEYQAYRLRVRRWL